MESGRKPLTGAHLVVEREKDGTPRWAVKFRDPNRVALGKSPQRKLRLDGDAWLERDEDGSAGPHHWIKYEGWRKRPGKRRPGFLDEPGAWEAAKARMERYEAEERAKTQPVTEAVTFREAADAWLAERVAVGGITPSTLRDYEAMLRDRDHAPAKRGRAPRARIMRRFGHRDVADVTAGDVREWLAELDADPTIGPRAINKHRQVLLSIMAHAVEEGWRDDNPVTGTKKRKEPPPRELVTYSPAQVFAIAGEAESAQDAAQIVTAAMSGLRQGELLALRWRDIRADSIYVAQALSARQVGAPKWGKRRSLPLTRHVREALDGLRERGHHLGPDDLVFCRADGGHLDGGSVSRRFLRARDRAAQNDPTMPKIGWRELRNTYGTTLAEQGERPLAVGAWYGHADPRTTARYLHFQPRPDDAERVSRYFDV